MKHYWNVREMLKTARSCLMLFGVSAAFLGISTRQAGPVIFGGICVAVAVLVNLALWWPRPVQGDSDPEAGDPR